ncbi:MAG: hypothetical protein EBX52_08865 [Proteobacteria bacterium]|nr:hypothetical protein [Pseudomonadota bacterium]
MNQEETMIKQVARERKRALTQALWNVLTDLESLHRTGTIPKIEGYWRGSRVVLIDDREAVREQHERIQNGRPLREWEDLWIYSPHAKEIGFILRCLSSSFRNLMDRDQRRACHERIFRMISESGDRDARVVVNGLLAEARRLLLVEVEC